MTRHFAPLALIAALGTAGAARAAPSYVFTLSPAALIGAASGTIHLDGTFTNNTGARFYLNGIQNNTGSFTPYITGIDDDAFLDTAPLYLEANASATFAVYDVTYANAAKGLYPVFTSVTLVGGATDASQDFFQAGNLPTILIAGAATSPAVPETSSWAMLIAGIGVAGAALRISRRRVAFAA